MRRHGGWVAAALAVGALLGGTAVALGGYVAGDGTIQGCVAKHGVLHVVKAGKRCKAGQASLPFSQRGPMGLRGPRGAKGQRGLTGAPGPGAIPFHLTNLNPDFNQFPDTGDPYLLKQDCTSANGMEVSLGSTPPTGDANIESSWTKINANDGSETQATTTDVGYRSGSGLAPVMQTGTTGSGTGTIVYTDSEQTLTIDYEWVAAIGQSKATCTVDGLIVRAAG